MTDYSRILETKKSAQSRLMAIPGVHAVGIGPKTVGGERTTEPAIIVFLLKKRPLSELSPTEVVPAEIDGVKTDVVELGKPRILAAPEEDPDDHDYWSFGSITLSGGMQIQAARTNLVGTLGFIAHTNEPNPKIVAVTNHHVVGVRPGVATGLQVTVSPDQRTFTFSGTNTPGSLVVANFQVLPTGGGQGQDVDVFWTTTDTDNPNSVASNLRDSINNLGNPGVKASAAGAAVTIIPQGAFAVLADCEVDDPHSVDDNADLRRRIEANKITFDGKVSDKYGIYTNVHSDGTQPSFGTFVSVDEKNDLASVATLIATSINDLHIAGFTATANGAAVTIAGAKAVECDIRSDVRAGQPENSFCSKCCWCCNDRIGRVLNARLVADMAIIQLDPGVKYKAEILQTGIVKGDHDVTDAEAIGGTYAVTKRGRTTRFTRGAIAALHTDGQIEANLIRDDGTRGNLFHRHYSNVMIVVPDASAKFTKEGKEVLIFGDEGDSGSAIVNSSNEIVGLFFGGAPRPNGDHWGLATPIHDVLQQLDLSLEIASAPDVVKTVPAPVSASAVNADSGAAQPLAPVPMQRTKLREMERQIRSTPAGEKYAHLVRRHFPEAQAIISKNRRMAAIWTRNGGPQILQGLINTVQSPEQAIPSQINGKPVTECFTGIQQAFIRYGSQELAADLREHGPALTQLAGLTYPQALDMLRNMRAE